MPHSRRLSPEAPEEDREDESSRNLNSPAVSNADPSPQVAPNRRDENSISFRHFLQPHSDVVPTRSRNSRGGNSGSVDLVDGAASALPDFVQDHLVAETNPAAASASSSMSSEVQNSGVAPHGGGSCPLDFSPESSRVSPPDFPASHCSNKYVSKKNRRQPDSSNLNLSGPSCSQAAVALPDFLSDGPMQCSSNVADGGILNPSASCSPNRVGSSSGIGCASSLRASSSGRSVESLSQEVERLRRELSDKNRRINQLESELSRQRSETSMFEAAYLNSEQGLQAATRRALAGEARITELSDELLFLKDRYSERLSLNSRSKGDSATASVSRDHTDVPTSSRNGHSNSSVDPNRVMEIAYSAEYLVSELMDQLRALKRVAVNPKKEEESSRKSNGKGKKKSSEEPTSSKQ